MRTTSQRGRALIEKHEGLRLLPYLCPAGIPTIGFGNTFYPNGRRVRIEDPPLTRSEANELLAAVLVRFEKSINTLVTKQITQNQFDALVSFVYNVGTEAFRRSTLLRVINSNPGNFAEIERQFLRWDKGGGRVLPGLVARRRDEFNLYAGQQVGSRV
jgi:lysozyme